MVFLGVYYTLLDIGELGAEGLMLTKNKAIRKTIILDAERENVLAELEKAGKIRAVITQNIDGLHHKAGSKEVMELHGSIHRNYCQICNKEYDLDYILESDGIPRCECGGIVKPDVVLYEEPLNNAVLSFAIDYISNAETLIIGGTSLVVYPAAGLINYFNGKNLVLINKSETPYDNDATLVINDAIGETLSQIKVK
jgi:NAD-dependent deacetylase